MIITGTATLKSRLIDSEGKAITEVIDGNGRVRALIYDKVEEGTPVHVVTGVDLREIRVG